MGKRRVRILPIAPLKSFLLNSRGLAWLVIIFGFLLCRIGFVENVVYNIDEAEYGVAADALNHGWLPGVDLLGTTKPPGIALLFNALFHTFGRSLAVVHVAHLVIAMVAGFLLVELAIGLWGLAGAIPAAMLYWMASNSWNLPMEMIALNVESPGMLFALGALLLAWKWPERRGTLFVAELALGMGALFRQTIGIFLLPVLVAMALTGTKRLTRSAMVVAGLVVPWIPVLIVYASRGALGWAWDSWVRYPLDYSSDTGLIGFLEAFYLNTTEFLMQGAVPSALALGGAILLWKERTSRRFRFLAALFIASALALASGSRFFGHYWIQFFPVLALLGVPAWISLRQGTRQTKWLLGGAVVVGSLIAALHFPTWRSWDAYAPPRGQSHFRLGESQRELQIASFVKTHTRPDETIAVWGYCPQIYWESNRLPGVRDYLCHYITGYSPGSFDPFTQKAFRSSGHPRAEEMFVEDLQRRNPKYIFDLVKITDYTFPFLKYSIREYPKLAEYMRLNYLPEGEIDSVPVYRHRTPQDTWWPEKKDIE